MQSNAEAKGYLHRSDYPRCCRDRYLYVFLAEP
jgi:hypothetical protein